MRVSRRYLLLTLIKVVWMMRIYRFLWLSVMSLYFFCTHAMAGISLDSTRIIFAEGREAKSQSIGVTSSTQSATPYLVKAQVMGDVRGIQMQTPFSITPSLFRLEPGSSNQLRILKTGNQVLPQDRESIFYLRVMALPSGQEKESTSTIKLGGAITVSTGNVIKLFYRPSKLLMTPQQAMASLQFSRHGHVLQVNNPTPYFVTLSSLSSGGKIVPISVREQNTMIEPFGTMAYPGASVVGKVTWKAINDYGGMEVFHGVIR